MVDFANSNLCGASPEMNDLFKKLDEAAADIESKIDAAASTAAAAFSSAQTELNSLTAKLQSIEIPQLPKLNLQAEIKALSELVPGTPAYLSSLATIKKEFESDLEAAGKDLGTLISDGLSAITSGGNICNVVPNVEKEAGSTTPAVEKATNVLQAATPPLTEAVSKVTQNTTITAKTEELAKKVEEFAVGTAAKPLTVDTAKFKFPPKSFFKQIQVSPSPQQLPQPSNITLPKSLSAPAVITSKVETPAERKNVIKKDDGDGFTTRRASKWENFSFAGLPRKNGKPTKKIDVVDGNWQLHLDNKPIQISVIYAHVKGVPKNLYDDALAKLYKLPKSTVANKQFMYPSSKGPHMSIIQVNESELRTQSPQINMSVFGNTLIIGGTLPVEDHPGNIDSGGTWRFPDTDKFQIGPDEWTLSGTFIRPDGTTYKSDAKMNRLYTNVAIKLKYYYLERYDPNYKA